MEIHENGQPIFRFSMFEHYWKNKQQALERYFPEDVESPVSDWMRFGSKCAAALEERPLPQWVAHLALPQYDIQEYRIIENLDGYWVRGTLDRYSTELHKILDDKCAKVAWTPKKAQQHVQLDFYSVLVEHRHGWVDDESHIHCIPIDKDENDIIRFTGEPAIMLPHITTQAMRDELKEKIISTAKDITVCWEAYQRGDIKL